MNWRVSNENIREAGRTSSDPYRFNRCAQQFVDWLGAKERYPLYYRDRFYTYDGTRYIEIDNLAQEIRTFFNEQNLAQSNHMIGNVKPIVENIAYRATDKYGEMPFYVGDDTNFPSHGKLVAYQNGILDLERFERGEARLLPHSSKWISTFCLPYDFDPNAKCTRWLSFLDDVFEGDQQRVDLLQEWFGYCLTADISQHKALVKIGPPRAGKGTTDAILRAVVGEDHTTGFNLHYLADKFGPRRLEGKLVAFIGEVNLAKSRDKYRILETWNSIVGGDPVPIERKNKDESPSMILPTRFSISCNEMPSFVDPTGALTARLLILNYDKSNVGKEDRNLTDKLLSEIVGISNWALAGYVRLRKNGGFSESDKMTDLLTQFRRDNSHLFAFMQDFLVVNRSLDPGNLDGVRIVDHEVEIHSVNLERAYSEWCSTHSVDGNFNWLGRSLKAMLPKLESQRKRAWVEDLYGGESKKKMVVNYLGIGPAV